MVEGNATAKSVSIAFALGCPRVQVDTAKFFEYFAANGWSIADRVEEADMVVVTACGFSAHYEEYSMQLLEAADRRRKPGSKLVVVGCLAGIDKARLDNAFDAALVAPKDATRLDEIIDAAVGFKDVDDPLVIEPYVERASSCFSYEERRGRETAARASVHRLRRASGIKSVHRRGDADASGDQSRVAKSVCSIRVAQGCMGTCTYCAIRFAAGPLQSKPLDEVLAEFDSGLSQGCTEFRLIAGDLGCYGQDIGTNVAVLLERMMQRSAAFRLTLQDFDLRWFVMYQASLIELLSSNHSRVGSVLVPLQSGSERILALMRRGHTASDAKEALCALRAASPDMVLDTHVLVGFPGETRRDFDDTLRFLKAVRFDHVTGYDYEDRPGTEASQMPDKVPHRVVKSRGFRLRRETESLWAGIDYYFHDWGLSPKSSRSRLRPSEKCGED